MSSNLRTIESIVRGQATSDGAGVKLTRVLTQDLQQRLDPFLMLDSFRSDDPKDYGAGFPDHPHRGFETVTYMLTGNMRHFDSAGNSGLLTGGGAQWMTAGRGLVHSEMPEQIDGLMEGFQLWVNLPAKYKLCAPLYQDLTPDSIAHLSVNANINLKAIAGTFEIVTGEQTQQFKGTVQRPDTEPIYLDVHFSGKDHITLRMPPGHNAFVYTYRGEVSVAGTALPDKRMGILSNNGNSDVRIDAAGAARCIVIAGRPLREPIVQYGPFVMNTREEIITAFEDFEAGRIKA